MDEVILKLSTLCQFKGDTAATRLTLPSLRWIGSSTSQLDIQNSMASVPHPSMDRVIAFSVFPTLLGPVLVVTPTLSALPEHTHRRGVTIFTQHDHQGRPVDVHSATININGVAIQTLRRGVEPG